MNKKVIVFGATGTLGAHITTHLQQKGYQVYAVGHRKSDNGFFGDYNVPYYSLDIENMEQSIRYQYSIALCRCTSRHYGRIHST